VIESNQPKKPIPPGLHGGDRRSAGARSSSQNENLKAFVTDIAVKNGKGRSTVARDEHVRLEIFRKHSRMSP
jgi:hypothetical protein